MQSPSGDSMGDVCREGLWFPGVWSVSRPNHSCFDLQLDREPDFDPGNGKARNASCTTLVNCTHAPRAHEVLFEPAMSLEHDLFGLWSRSYEQWLGNWDLAHSP